jgi:hypothetical protein
MPNSQNNSPETSRTIAADDIASATDQAASTLFLLYPENQQYLDGVSDKPVVNIVSPLSFAFGWAAVVFLISIFAVVPFVLDDEHSLLAVSPLITTALAFACLFIRRRHDCRQLLQDGQILDGRVLDSGITSNEKMKFWFDMLKSFTPRPRFLPGDRVILSIWVRYLFRSPAARAIYGYERAGQKFDRGIPPPGKPVKILYFSDGNFKIL